MIKCVKQLLKDCGSPVKCCCEECQKEGVKYGVEYPELWINASKGDNDDQEQNP